jgi:hypothetical protein
MQLQIINGYITGYSTQGGFKDGITVVDSFIDLLDNEDQTGYLLYIDENTKPIYDKAKHDTAKTKQLEEEIRIRRTVECFVVTDRGKLWYDSITQQQLQELKTWHTAWLAAPETKIIPPLPTFLVNRV